MADQTGLMTLARAQIASLRLQGLTLTTLVERGVISPSEGAALVREAATHLQSMYNSPEIQQLFAGTYEQIATEIGSHPTP